LRQKLRTKLLEKTVNEFHKEVYIKEVAQQMLGILLAPSDLTPSTIEYKLKKRAAVARLLFKPLNELNKDQVIQVRVKLVHNLAQLSKRQETPHSYKMSRRRKSKDAWQDIEPCS
jgi:hypothetical protein